MNIDDVLKSLGFKDKKAQVYRVCLELGQANAQEIAKLALIERTSVYAILDSLVEDGLISAVIKKKRKIYISENPDNLMELLKGKVELLEKTLPMFASLFREASKKPQIRYYQGRENLKEILKDSLSCQEKVIRHYTSAQDIVEIFGKEYLEHYVEKRVKNGISVLSLRPKDKEADNWYLKAGNKDVLRDSRFLPEKISFDVVCFIYDNKVSIISSQTESFGFIVESKEFSEFMKSIFYLIWDSSSILI
ncbi:MAG: helix-turn-helix domain-containing protein [Candidatus Buchananbacteria bacterium]|jgi:sugar-specific transcriptional regulator TrmB